MFSDAACFSRLTSYSQPVLMFQYSVHTEYSKNLKFIFIFATCMCDMQQQFEQRNYKTIIAQNEA
jgi:hypothetical protein